MVKIFNFPLPSLIMTSNFDSIPVITIILFTLGLIGVMVYEKLRSNTTKKSIV
jgi:hypothetical protein